MSRGFDLYLILGWRVPPHILEATRGDGIEAWALSVLRTLPEPDTRAARTAGFRIVVRGDRAHDCYVGVEVGSESDITRALHCGFEVDQNRAKPESAVDNWLRRFGGAGKLGMEPKLFVVGEVG